MKKRTKFIASLLVIFVIIVAVVKLASPSSADRTITIAVVESDPGSKDNPNPQSIYAGVKVAVDQINALDDVDIQIDLYDDEGDPVQAQIIASEIVKSNAVAVIGHSSIETSDATAEIYDMNMIPVINVIPATEDLTESHPYHFNITYTAETEAAYLANYLIRVDDKVTAGIIHTDDNVDQLSQRIFRNQFVKLGGVTTFREVISLPATAQPDITVQSADSAETSASDTSFQVSTVEAQLKDIVEQLANIPSGDQPSFLFIAANQQIIDRLNELFQENGISIPVKGVEILSNATLTDMIDVKYASIISTGDEYGKTLAKQFRNTFTGLGGKIIFEGLIGENGGNLENIYADLIASGNPGTVFIATDDATAVNLLVWMKQIGISFPIVGASTLSAPKFLEQIGNTPEEATSPGYFTNDIITTRSIIFDSANAYANQFVTDYHFEPSDHVVNGYDAVITVFAAIQRSGVGLKNDEPLPSRQAIYKSLMNMDSVDNSVQGLVGKIYFKSSRSVERMPHFGVYLKGQLVSGPFQYEPVSNLNSTFYADLQEQIKNGKVSTVNGQYVNVVNIVYVGIDPIKISGIDLKSSSYKMDFYLWFRYSPSLKPAGFDSASVVFANSDDLSKDSLKPIPNRSATNGIYMTDTYRVKGTFSDQFLFYEYPFDNQNLVFQMRPDYFGKNIRYAVDRVGMDYANFTSRVKSNLRDERTDTTLNGWKITEASVSESVISTSTSLGNVQSSENDVSADISHIILRIGIQREPAQLIIKNLLPLLITLILAYITFYLPLGHSSRWAVGSSALLTTALFHVNMTSSLPEIPYTVAMEYFFYASYMLSAMTVLLETISIQLDKKSEKTDSETEKNRYQHYRGMINTAARIVYPCILGLLVFIGVLVRSNLFQLDPEIESKNQVVGLPGDSVVSQQPEQIYQSETSQSDQVNLTLSSWRPEDVLQINKLLDAFSEYAKSQGQDIAVTYRPILSANYDSILDIQLSRGEGPDLFYVRPFSVDGNIAKYLTRLNDDLDIQGNYDATKIVPWTNKTGSYYAVPYIGVVQGVYYNKDLFQRYGLTVPTTWEQFMDTVKMITEKDPSMIPIANALNQSEDSEMFMSIAANFLGGPEGRESLMRTDGTSICYNSQKVVSTFQAIEDLKPYLPRDVATMFSYNSKELFLSGHAVMLFGGSWDLQVVSENADFEWDVFAVPSPTLNTYVIFQPDVGIGINRESPHSEEARMFLQWVMSKEAVGLTAENLAGFYPLNGLTKDSKARSEDDAKFLRLVNTYEGDIRWMYTEISSKVPSADAIIRKDLYNMVAFDLTPQEAAQHLQSGLGEWYEPAQSCK